MKIFFLLLFFPVTLLSQSAFNDAEKLYKSGKYLQAKELFEQNLESNPNHLKTLEYLGDIQCRFQNWDKAIVCYKKLKTINPKVSDYQYKYGGALAMVAAQSNKLKALTMIDDIETSFQNAIKYNPKHIEARWALIEFYLRLPGIFGGSESKASLYANELLALSPVDGYLAKGHISEYFKRFPLAENYYKKAIHIGHSKTTYQKLANLYKNKMNQPEKALQLMKNFSEQD